MRIFWHIRNWWRNGVVSRARAVGGLYFSSFLCSNSTIIVCLLITNGFVDRLARTIRSWSRHPLLLIIKWFSFILLDFDAVVVIVISIFCLISPWAWRERRFDPASIGFGDRKLRKMSLKFVFISSGTWKINIFRWTVSMFFSKQCWPMVKCTFCYIILFRTR